MTRHWIRVARLGQTVTDSVCFWVSRQNERITVVLRRVRSLIYFTHELPGLGGDLSQLCGLGHSVFWSRRIFDESQKQTCKEQCLCHLHGLGWEVPMTARILVIADGSREKIS
jgi:hypothetical protein